MPIYTARYISNEIDASALTNTYRYFPNGYADQERKGELHCLITVIGEKDIQADRVAKFVWDSIVDTYYFSTFETVIDNLKRAVEVGSKKAGELIKNGDGNSFNLSFAIALFKGKGAYLTVFGEQQMLLYKNGGFVKVSDIVIQNKGVVASMAWSNADLLILGSPNVLDGFTQVVKIGDSPAEIAKVVSTGAQSLQGYQSILLISGSEIFEIDQAIKPEKKAIEEVIAVSEDTNIAEIEEPEIPNFETESNDIVEPILEEVVTVKKVKRKPVEFKIFFSKTKDFFQNLISKISPVLSKLGNVLGKVPEYILSVFRKIFSKLNVMLLDKYGRAHWYKRIMSKLSSFSFMKKKSGIGIKIDGYKENDIRKKRFAIVFYIILAGFSLYFLIQYGTKTAANKKISKEVTTQLIQLETKVDDIEKIRLTDSEQAQLDMFSLKDSLVEIEQKKLPVDVQVRFNTLKEKYSNLENLFLKRFYLTDNSESFSLIFDGRARFGDTTAISDITTYKDDLQNEYLLITDTGNHAVYKMNLTDNSVSSFSDTKKLLKAPKFVDYGSDGVYIYDEESGILKSPFTKNSTFGNIVAVAGLDRDVIGKSDVVDLAIIGALDNVYLLSSSDSAIMKSSKSGSGYSYPFAYISSKSFASAHNLANDISFYAMTSGIKGIERYSNDYVKGGYIPNKVTLEDLSGTPTNFKAGYTASVENAKFYAFEESERRVLVFEKPIESGSTLVHPKQMLLEKQFLYKGDRGDTFADVKEVSADYFEKNMYVLDGNRIWQISLK